MFKQIVILLALATLLSVGVNLVSPNRIPLVGQWPSLHTGSDPIVPPDPQPGDPPFIALDVAEMEFYQGDALFVDAREPDEFECGTIESSINVPFDLLPDGDLQPYFDSIFTGYGGTKMIITYCSGEECDLSLHLARNLKAHGYGNAAIFFGGWREWESNSLPVERRRDCSD